MEAGDRSNLTSHRAAESVWDKRGWQGVTIEERLVPWFMLLAGSCVLVYGVTRRSWQGLAVALTGVGMIGCVSAGLCDPRHAGVRLRHLRRKHSAMDQVAVESMDSFPASDAPSFTTAATTQSHEERMHRPH